MRDQSDLELICADELTEEELSTISGPEVDLATFFQALSNTLRAISDVNKSIIANMR